MKNILKLNEEFKRIKKLGFTKTILNGSGGVGRTFEYLLGKSVDVSDNPDYEGIEIKCRRSYTKALISLFNATLDSEENAINKIVNKYGYPDYMLRSCKVLSAKFNSKEKTRVGFNYKFSLKVNRNEEKIMLLVYDKNDNLIDDTYSWSFKLLEQKLAKKLKLLAIVLASRKFVDNIEYFHYLTIRFYELKEFNHFIDLLDSGDIWIEMKVGVYHSGDRIGIINDKGTSFKIEYNNIEKLFTRLYVD